MRLTERKLRSFVLNALKQRGLLNEAGTSSVQKTKSQILKTLGEIKKHIEGLSIESKTDMSEILDEITQFNGADKDSAGGGFSVQLYNGTTPDLKSPTEPGAGSSGSEGGKTDSDDLETRRRNWKEGKDMLTDDKMKEILASMFVAAQKKKNPSDRIQEIIRKIFMRSEKPVYEEEIFTSYLEPLLEKLTQLTKVIEEVIEVKPDFKVNDVFEGKVAGQPIPVWLKEEILKEFREPVEDRKAG